MTIEGISHALQTKNFESWNQIAPLIMSHISSDDEMVIGLLENIQDQVTIAMSNMNDFDRWGKHYLRSLIRSLQLQIKNNFKDPAVAHFGGDLFKKLVEHADSIFDNMPPPKPSKFNEKRSIRVESMKTYNNCRSSCFAGHCLIKMADGSEKQVKDLVKGDLVSTPSGSAKLVCMLKTVQQGGMAELCTIPGGLIITAWHPVLSNGTWTFPNDLVQPVMQPCEAVYSLVLANDHIATINGTQVICLGHGYTQGILNHQYFGTQKVIDDLKLMPGYE